MSEQTYRSGICTPRLLFDAHYAKRIQKEFGTEGLGRMMADILSYFEGEQSREEILAANDNPALRIAFEKYCDEMDEEDAKWEKHGTGRRKNAPGPEAKNVPAEAVQTVPGKQAASSSGRSFQPPRTEDERRDFLVAVQSFAAESGLAGFDAEAFVQALEIKGWKTFRGVTVVCWKQAARKWHLSQIRRESEEVSAAEKTEMHLSAPDAAAEEIVSAADAQVPAPTSAGTEHLLLPSLPDGPDVAAEKLAAGAEEAGSPLPYAVLSSSGRLVVGSDIPSLNRCIQANGGKMYPEDYRTLLGFTERFPEEMICRAAALAEEHASYNQARYICTVLQNWEDEGKRSLVSLVGSRARFTPPSYPQRPAPPPSYTDERARETVLELMARYGAD